MHARENCLETWSSGGEYRGGERGGERGRGGGGRDRDEHQDHRGDSQAPKTLLPLVRLVWRKRIEDLKIIGGVTVSYAPPPTPDPSTANRTDWGGKPPNTGKLDRTPGAAWQRPPVSRTGGRWVTTGATGGTANKRKTDREEARGGERDARAVKLFQDMELGRGNPGGGREVVLDPSG